jgi:hypothetical protein
MNAPSLDRSVTAIIATYNRGRLIEQAIDSVLEQREPVAQLIVVDDGSTDDTATRLRKYGERIEYIRKPNGGKASAINLALPRARAEWVWLFDDDDIALPDGTQLLLDALDLDRRADFAFGGQVIAEEGPDGRLVGHRHVAPRTEAGDTLLLDVLQGFCFRLQAMLIRRRRLIEAGGLDERYLRGQDYELIVRLARRLHGTRVEQPILVWRQHTGDRGPAALRHSAADRDRSWETFDAMLGQEIRASLDLAEYIVPRPVEACTAEERSTALVHRAAVMGTKGLLPELVNDLVEAGAGNAGTCGLASAQRELLMRTALNPRFQSRLTSAPAELPRAIRRVPRSRLLREAAGCLVRGLLYAARSGGTDRTRRLRYLRSALTLAAFAGPRALVAAWSNSKDCATETRNETADVKPPNAEEAA